MGIRTQRTRRVQASERIEAKPGRSQLSRATRAGLYRASPRYWAMIWCTDWLTAIVWLLAGIVAHGTAYAACEVHERTVVPFTWEQGHLMVPLMVNDVAARFVLDTGAERSLVTPESVRRLGLSLDPWVGTVLRGVGGIVEHPNADPRSLALGGVPLRRRTITQDTSLTVGALPAAADGDAVDGLLGRDFLSPFDLELDMHARRLTLYSVMGCAGRFLPWPMPYETIQAEMPMTNALVFPITLDRTRLAALLDTGSFASMVTLRGARRLGLAPSMLSADPTAPLHGVGRRPPEMFRHQFTTLQIGTETIPNPTLWVAPIRVTPIVDALLGAEWLARQARVWISFTTAQIFFVRQ